MEKSTELLNSLSHVDAAIIAAMITASIAAIVTIVVTIINVHYNSKMTRAQIENNSEMTKAQIMSEEIRVSLPYLKDILVELRDVLNAIEERDSQITVEMVKKNLHEAIEKRIEVCNLAVKLYPKVSPYIKEEYKNKLNGIYNQIDQKITETQNAIINNYKDNSANEAVNLLENFKNEFKNCLLEEISSIMGSLRVYSDVNRILKK